MEKEVLQKENVTIMKNTFLKMLKIKNNRLKRKIKFFKSDLAHFVKSESNLNILLRRQKWAFDKGGVGYVDRASLEYYMNYFCES